MSDPLGLSIGTTNLVAASVGRQPVIRRSVLTLFGHAAPEVGVPTGHPGGMVLSGFVDRVGDSVPLVAADGASYPAEQLVVEALESMAALAAPTPPSGVAIAVPSYWSPAMSAALQGTLTASEILTPRGVVPRLIPDAVAALIALNANPGLDRRGVVALLDFGGAGTSITVADAASAFDVIDGTERIPEFAGDQIDQVLLGHVLDGIPGAGGDDGVDTYQTAAVGSLALLREQCRSAKERLSRQTVTELPVEQPGYRADIRVTRAELEELIARPLDGVVGALEDMLGRNNISWNDVSAVALVGGGASIPLIVQRLSERSQARVVTTPQPALDAGVGAALFAAYGPSADTATWVAAPAQVAGPPAEDPGSATFRALAWSQDDASGDDVIPYSGEDPYVPGDAYEPTETFVPDPALQDDVKPWHRLPMSVFGIAAAVALVAVGGVAIALTSVYSPDREQPRPGNVPLSSAYTPPGPAPETVTVSNQPVQPPAPAPSTAVVPPSVIVTATPPTTT
ncbi:MAG TPA: Hsp70 family protein, partial [Mycobacterium sp.]|nr:Hsp70 family protein [Mycobacterium sp.]